MSRNVAAARHPSWKWWERYRRIDLARDLELEELGDMQAVTDIGFAEHAFLIIRALETIGEVMTDEPVKRQQELVDMGDRW